MHYVGWGQWGGMGTRPSTKKIVVPVNWSKAKPRRDFNMKHVIINEERDKKAAKHFVRRISKTWHLYNEHYDCML